MVSAGELVLLVSGVIGGLASRVHGEHSEHSEHSEHGDHDKSNFGDKDARRLLKFVKDPPGDDESRCGICPSYIQKICGFDATARSTYIFDNHCVMNLFNCIKGSTCQVYPARHNTPADFQAFDYEHCLYTGNLAYVHGFKWEDKDYGDEDVVIRHSKKQPPQFEYDNN